MTEAQPDLLESKVSPGKTFGRLTVISRSNRKLKSGNYYWNAVCDCGKQVQVQTWNIKSGATISCGCHRRERMARKNTIHGLSSTVEWKTWSSMKERCYLKSSTHYRSYGGRGIAVCARWLESFENFLADMGKRPSPEMSIDRIDVNGHYGPENCRWASPEVQANNKRGTRLISAHGKTQSVAMWSRETGLSTTCIHLRLKRGEVGELAIRMAVRGDA